MDSPMKVESTPDNTTNNTNNNNNNNNSESLKRKEPSPPSNEASNSSSTAPPPAPAQGDTRRMIRLNKSKRDEPPPASSAPRREDTTTRKDEKKDERRDDPTSTTRRDERRDKRDEVRKDDGIRGDDVARREESKRDDRKDVKGDEKVYSSSSKRDDKRDSKDRDTSRDSRDNRSSSEREKERDREREREREKENKERENKERDKDKEDTIDNIDNKDINNNNNNNNTITNGAKQQDIIMVDSNDDDNTTNNNDATTNNDVTTANNNPENGNTNSENGNAAPPAIPEKPRSKTTITGCRSVDNFQKLNKIEEGTYGVVYRAKDKETGEIVALKKLKMDREREGFPITSLREIKILITFKHPNIVDVKEVVVGNNLNSIFIVMEFVDHDLKTLMEEMKTPFTTAEVKTLLRQLLEAIAYLHDNWVIHRDLKTSNLLYNNHGMLKVADFGLAREYGSPLKIYTHNVVTLWYRAPELLLGQKKYTPAIDVWSIGCIFAELSQISKEPLLPGRSELDQIDKIFKLLGTANDKIWPGFSQLPNARKVNFAIQPYNNLRQKFPNLTEIGFDLLNKMLTYDPSKRLTAVEALRHPFFSESPPPKPPSLMPTWPSVHEGGPSSSSRKKPRRPSKDFDDEMQRDHRDKETNNEDDRQAGRPFVLKM